MICISWDFPYDIGELWGHHTYFSRYSRLRLHFAGVQLPDGVPPAHFPFSPNTSTLRTEDCAIRHGGDEFAVLMPNQTVSEAKAVARRIQDLFGQMPWPHRAAARPTLSIGIASAWCGDPKGAVELLRRADTALYRAKSAGRDRVTAYEDQRTVA